MVLELKSCELPAFRATGAQPQVFTQQICGDADPDDDAVLSCALGARANLIVTSDKDLLVLHPWRDIRILNSALR